jgi:hypothetical protein
MKMIVPSKSETASTGFIMAGEDTWRGKSCRVELWTDAVRCKVNDTEVKIGEQPRPLAKKLLEIARQTLLASKFATNY